MTKPVLDGLESWFFLNETLQKASTNFARKSATASVVGNPVVSEHFTSFQGMENYLQTDVLETTDATFFVVARTSEPLTNIKARPMYFGTFKSLRVDGTGNGYGVSLGHASETLLTAFAARENKGSKETSAPVSVAANENNSWSLLSVVTTNGFTLITDHTRHLQKATSAGVGKRVVTTGALRIGSGYQDYRGSCDIAMFSSYSRELISDEIETTVTNIRSYMARRAISV